MSKVFIKLKNNHDGWYVEQGFMKENKWYLAEEKEKEFVISQDNSEHGGLVFLGKFRVDVKKDLTLEPGKKYVTNGGEVVGPMRGYKQDMFDQDDSNDLWLEDGIFFGQDREYDRSISHEYIETKPYEEVTIKRLKAGEYGRIKLSTDGYHAINIDTVRKGESWSVDDIREAIKVLEMILEAKG